MRKIVVNRCYGGFGLSHEGMLAYARHKGLTVYPKPMLGYPSMLVYWIVPEPIETPANWSVLPLGERQRINAEVQAARISKNDIQRDDPALVAAVEELGAAANGAFAKLEIVEIPDDVDWEIDEYDGREWVAEKHRTW
ncbi:hypothetical protein KNJ79_05205 [Sphingopyxis indica]|uniref:hypothetical protein n=1 Tax=Sphingopyxis indica TaxID=436663 RepID=UPI002938E1B3|nr:hypothetical protein [Sphingopyxis indica]WOF44330.1 hypothetical protein KNJ79_05205 [Sphingopyxis indica]